MNNNAKKWLKALKSGKYKQTAGALKHKEGFCCLGVLCEVYNENSKTPIKPKKIKNQDSYVYNNNHSFPPNIVAEWAGLKIEAMTNLTHFNDVQEYSFEKIASLMEKTPKKYFEEYK